MQVLRRADAGPAKRSSARPSVALVGEWPIAAEALQIPRRAGSCSR